MKLRILLTGKNGQIGQALCTRLPLLGEVTALDRQQLNLCHPAEIRHAIGSIRPQLIVNAAAYTSVDKAESDPSAAQAVNHDAPRIIAEEARRIGAALVHYSTDYVFDGAKREPYLEGDVPRPLNVYGRTKLAGDEAIQKSGLPYLIFRTSWVYARGGNNFLLTILRLATQREELRVIRDQTGAPTWSCEIAAATTNILSQVYGREDTDGALAHVSGVYHMTAAGETTWYDFARAILEVVCKSASDTPWFFAKTSHQPWIVRRILPISTAQYPACARRPAYSVLCNARLAQVFRIRLPDWRLQLHSFFEEIRRDPKHVCAASEAGRSHPRCLS
jgi:dTDP-4-dehydrorhamnose reductase